jgi:hypothetical protein
MGIYERCPHCGSGQLRFSHFRFRDLSKLLFLQKAIRCRECQERFYLSIFSVMNMALKWSAPGGSKEETRSSRSSPRT